MSGKQTKKVRKYIKNYLETKEPMNPSNQEIQYSFKQLETFIQLSVFLTGKKPEKIELVEGYYQWYAQEVLNQAEAMGLKPGFKDEQMTFLGIPLEKKVTILTPEQVMPKN